MKLILSYTLLALLLVCVCVSAKNELEEELANSTELIDVLKMILNDPEFLALSKYEQYKILEAVYTIVVNYMKDTDNARQKFILQKKKRSVAI